MRFLSAPVIAVLVFICSAASAADGLVSVKSPAPVGATMDRLEQIARDRGLVIFARIDHAAGAAKVGASLRPTELLIFGNPKGGSKFMGCAQSVAIDLPLKALVWEDADGQVWVGYNDPAYLAQRHGAGDCPVVGRMHKGVSGLIEAAVAP